MTAVWPKSTTFCAVFKTPLGDVLAAASDAAVTGLWFTERSRYLPGVAEVAQWIYRPKHSMLLGVEEWLEQYFNGLRPEVEMPLKPAGSEFQTTVWNLLRMVPHGSTVSYGELALAVMAEQGRDRPPAARAIGRAVGHNPITLLIPCHRVIGSDGQLTGYGGGLDRKKALLKLEGVTLV